MKINKIIIFVAFVISSLYSGEGFEDITKVKRIIYSKKVSLALLAKQYCELGILATRPRRCAGHREMINITTHLVRYENLYEKCKQKFIEDHLPKEYTEFDEDIICQADPKFLEQQIEIFDKMLECKWAERCSLKNRKKRGKRFSIEDPEKYRKTALRNAGKKQTQSSSFDEAYEKLQDLKERQREVLTVMQQKKDRETLSNYFDQLYPSSGVEFLSK